MYFDLHCHPSFKPFLSHFDPAHKDHCWKNYNSLGSIMDSQSSLLQLKEGNVRVATATIYVMEKGMSSSFMIQYIVPMLSKLHKEMLKTLPTSEYYDRLNEEINHLIKSSRYDVANGQEFKIISSIDEIEDDKLNLILAIEGGYSLSKTNSRLFDKLLELKNGPHKFLYMTLVHATQFKDYCTHAFSMKLVKDNPVFKPRGYGFSKQGFEIIDLAYDKTQGNRILIDVKHMSLVSRMQFYEYRRNKNYENIPLVATHMGFTGISWKGESIAQYVKERKAIELRSYIQVLYDRPEGIGTGKKKTHFNPWSVNLYNEEIPIILDSGGLIGFNLDQRILGAQPVKGEFFAKKEFESILGNRVQLEPGDFEDERLADEIIEEEEAVRGETGKPLKHLRHLCNQILHVVHHGGSRAWDQMCIGSDFDGLIDPINSCTNSSQFSKLEEDLVDELPKMIEEADELYPGFDFEAGDIKKRVRGIMYDNAINFLKKHF